MLRMGDGPVADLPAGLDAYAGYADQGGIGVTWPAVQLLPAAYHLSISIHGAPAMCGDVENGALNSWNGYDVGYVNTSNAGALILRDGRPRKLWTAHYTNTAHICTSAQCWPSSPVPWEADGTQWTDHGGLWDESQLADDFFDFLDPSGGTLSDLSDATIAKIVAGVQFMMRQEMAGDPNELYGRTMQACVEAIRHESATIQGDVTSATQPSG